MKLLFTICGRAGSKGVKNKNIRNLVGKPLAYYCISAIDLYTKKHPNIEFDIVASSDSDRFLDIMQANKMLSLDVIRRDSALCNDNISKVVPIRNCYKIMANRNSSDYDAVVDLDITSPLRRVLDVENLISTHFETNADVTTSGTPARRNPYFNQARKCNSGWKKVIDSDASCRQDAPLIYDLNASLYCYKPDYLLSSENIFEGHCEIIEMPDTAILDIDHENDFELLEVIAQHIFGCNRRYNEVYNNIR